MKDVYYKPDNAWIGDLIPFGHDNKFYLYYLHDERKGKTEDDYGFGTSWNLLVTTDGTDIEDKGVVLPPGGIDDIDLSCYTGNVLEGPDGLFHLFYTAVNCDNPKYCRDGKPMQYIMHATSHDLIHWEKHYETAFGADERLYEVFDWRDPFVYYSEEDGCYNMLLAARQQGTSQKNGGCIGLCRSKDLWSWEVCEPFYDPQAYLTHECPDLFKMGNWWYLVYSTFSERFVTHYRMSRSPTGPWIAPPEDSFDGRGFYAAKTAEANGERWAFAWVPSKRGNNDYGQWEWGGDLVMHKLFPQADGRLFVGIPPAIHAGFSQPQKLVTPLENFDANTPWRLFAQDKKTILPFCELPDQFMLQADIAFSSGIRNFGIGIRQDADYADGYYFRVEPFYNRIVFDMWPRRVKGVNQWYVDGDKPFAIELERPYRMSDVRSLHLCLLADGDNCTLYVDNSVALTTRIYNLKGANWSFFAFDGNIEVSNIRLLTQR
ncbi:DUF4975 domain-containing protein [Affinibrenneria salicis]|uniref:beta-fructofuranosidase n=1 Tax=Affinibrenneria salicis TaxID=2590031 RepID=A0A5J5FRL5_9GAMM|nr:glycoside hydrolase family 32 protein [Affinibrenneria salicis]KAA8995610.1 DUF4975 domain-containing protein [Affinibrenneria salicis]